MNHYSSPRLNTRIPDPVQWAEGMLLTPQHLQQSDEYWHAVNRQQLSIGQPNFWGIMDMEIDGEALNRGQVLISRLDAVMPDGLLLRFDDRSWGERLCLDLKSMQDFIPGQRRRVYAAVPVGGVMDEGQIMPRFDGVQPTLARDENTGDNEVEVFRKRPRVSLSTDSHNARYVHLPLFEVECRSTGQYQLSVYHPPALRLAAWDFLERHSLAGQSRYLASRMRDKAETLAETGAASRKGSGGLDVQASLTALVSELPHLEVLSQCEETHPHSLYLALTLLSGRLATMVPGLIPDKPGPYQHDDCVSGLAQLMKFVNGILSEIQLHYRCLPFELIGEGRFRRTLSDLDLEGPILLELKPKRGQSREGLRRWLAAARIGRQNLLDVLRKLRSAGAIVRRVGQEERINMELPVSGLLVELKNQTVETGKRSEPAMAPGEPLVIEGSDQDAPEEIVLYQRRKGKESN